MYYPITAHLFINLIFVMPVFEKKCPNSNQLKAARAILGWDQLRCANNLRVSISSLRRYEGLGPLTNPYDSLRASVIERIMIGFENHGIEFVNDLDSLGIVLRA